MTACGSVTESSATLSRASQVEATDRGEAAEGISETRFGGPQGVTTEGAGTTDLPEKMDRVAERADSAEATDRGETADPEETTGPARTRDPNEASDPDWAGEGEEEA